MKLKRVGIYTRVSTAEQNTAAQEHELREYADRRGWVVARVYCDKGISGAAKSRPGLDELMKDCRRRKLDVVLVWKFDRFARSLRQLVSALELYRQLHIDFVSCTEAIDTSIPSGELVFQIFGAIAQFERALISERVRSGLAEARRNGKKIGRPALHVPTEDEKTAMRNSHKKGISLRGIAEKFGVSLWTAHAVCRKVQAC